MYKRIMLAVDGSEHSLRATQHGVYLASMLPDCSIEVVLVADIDKAKSELLQVGFGEQLQAVRRKRLEPIETLLKQNNLQYYVHILHGEPAPTVVQFANQNDIDLVIIGSRGLNTLQEMVLGSVSHKVVKRANCPVLVVK